MHASRKRPHPDSDAPQAPATELERDAEQFAALVLRRTVLAAWVDSPLFPGYCQGMYALVRPRGPTDPPQVMRILRTDATPASEAYPVQLMEGSVITGTVMTARKLVVQAGGAGGREVSVRLSLVSDQPFNRRQYSALVAAGVAPSRATARALFDKRERMDRDRRAGLYCSVGAGEGPAMGVPWGSPSAGHHLHLLLRSWLESPNVPPSLQPLPGMPTSAAQATSADGSPAPDKTHGEYHFLFLVCVKSTSSCSLM
jgi:hypothetical protein